MANEGYKALTVRLYATIAEVFRTGNSALLDPLLAPDMVDHAAPSGPVVGREPGKQLIATYARAFPDTTLTVDLMVAEADTVAAFVSYRSTHTGPFMGHAPTGKPVRVTGMDSMRYRDGQVIELWSQIDDSRPVAATGALHRACGTAAYRHELRSPRALQPARAYDHRAISTAHQWVTSREMGGWSMQADRATTVFVP